MKIIGQTQDQMSLKDGNINGLVIGIILLIGGGYFAYHTYSVTGMSNTLWAALVIAVIGLILLLSNATISVTLDKTQNQIFFSKKRLWGTTVKNYNIQDTLRVELRKA